MLFVEEMKCSEFLCRAALWLPGGHTSSRGSTGAAGIARQALTHLVCHIIVMFLQTCTHKLLEKFPVCNKRQFWVLEMNFLVHSAGNIKVKGKADVFLMNYSSFLLHWFCSKVSSLLGSALCIRMLTRESIQSTSFNTTYWITSLLYIKADF